VAHAGIAQQPSGTLWQDLRAALGVGDDFSIGVSGRKQMRVRTVFASQRAGCIVKVRRLELN